MGDAPIVGSVPHQHIFGLLYLIIWPLLAGRRLVTQRLRAAHLHACRAAARTLPRATWITTPSFLRQLRHDAFHPAPARLLLCSGAPLPPSLAGWAEDALQCRAVELLGSTETGGIAHRRAAVDAPFTPLPGVSWRLEGERLAVRSPFAVGEGNDFYRTADRVRPDAPGSLQFRFVGRGDRICKINDKPVNLSAIEAQLQRHPGVGQAHAFVWRGEIAIALQLSPAGQAVLQQHGFATLRLALQARLRLAVEDAAVPPAPRWQVVGAPPDGALKWSLAQLLGYFETTGQGDV